jgi:hypothetical protein
MKLLKTGILALSLTVTATVGLAADYEIFLLIREPLSDITQELAERVRLLI